MIRNLIITLVLYSSLAIGIAKGQQGVISSYSVEKIIPQSPEVSKFNKFGDYPVNLTSGLVDVTVPIYTIKTKALELPISISANLSRVRVDEVASSIGLGWLLNAGGMLSVDVRGARNDNYLSSGVKYKAPDANVLAAEEDNGTNYRNKINSYTYLDDTQSDKYAYHVSGGVSGSFVFDNEGKFMPIPISDNKVEINNRYFIVTSAEGKKYYFDRQLAAKTNVSGGMGGSSLNETGYYLTKILSADKRDSIVFEYKSMSPNNNTSVGFVGKRKSEISTTYTPQYFPMKHYDSYTYFEYSLEKITFNGGEVLFDFRIDREDKGACRLSAI